MKIFLRDLKNELWVLVCAAALVMNFVHNFTILKSPPAKAISVILSAWFSPLETYPCVIIMTFILGLGFQLDFVLVFSLDISTFLKLIYHHVTKLSNRVSIKGYIYVIITSVLYPFICYLLLFYSAILHQFTLCSACACEQFHNV